jgi:hypothetical protein
MKAGLYAQSKDISRQLNPDIKTIMRGSTTAYRKAKRAVYTSMRTTMRTVPSGGYRWRRWNRSQIVKFAGSPGTKGRGLGLYATADIWHEQELLVVNREYPMEPEVASECTEGDKVIDVDSDRQLEVSRQEETGTLEEGMEPVDEGLSMMGQTTC